jgi:hypothetical protein
MITRVRPGLLTKQYTFAGYLGNFAILTGPVLWLLYVLNPVPQTMVDDYVIFGLTAIVFIGVVVRAHDRRRRFVKRADAINVYAAHHAAQSVALETPNAAAPFSTVALRDIHNARDITISHIIKGTDWDYADLTYDLYRHMKNSDYKSATVYYGIMSVTLPRDLPNIFFDSKLARGRQFRFEFDSSQCVKLEGDFNDYFVTYFPPQYSIDGLSIISPDVMLALEAAKDYDIEIQGNRVYLYGPLYDVDQQLPDMFSKLQAIKKELLDNIVTYRDERLPYQYGRQRVAPLGMSLKRSKFWTYVYVTIFVLYILFDIYIHAVNGH